MQPIEISPATERRFVLGRQGLWPGRRWQGLAGAIQAVRTGEVFDLLLGDNLPGRKEHIANHGYEYLDDLDLS